MTNCRLCLIQQNMQSLRSVQNKNQTLHSRHDKGKHTTLLLSTVHAVQQTNSEMNLRCFMLQINFFSLTQIVKLFKSNNVPVFYVLQT